LHNSPIAIVINPVHHWISYKYPNPPTPKRKVFFFSSNKIYLNFKPARTDPVNLSRPFFLRMKLEPINKLDRSAKDIPI
jgi:hypothetical protein